MNDNQQNGNDRSPRTINLAVGRGVRRGALALTIGAVGGALLLPPMAAFASGGGEDHQVTYCHRRNSETNPYGPKAITTDKAAVFKKGHDGHTGPVFEPGMKADKDKWGDIIPPFDYVDNKGVTQHYAGMNWPEGKDILENGCQVPGETPTSTTTTTGHPSTTTTTTTTKPPTSSTTTTPEEEWKYLHEFLADCTKDENGDYYSFIDLQASEYNDQVTNTVKLTVNGELIWDDTFGFLYQNTELLSALVDQQYKLEVVAGDDKNGNAAPGGSFEKSGTIKACKPNETTPPTTSHPSTTTSNNTPKPTKKPGPKPSKSTTVVTPHPSKTTNNPLVPGIVDTDGGQVNFLSPSDGGPLNPAGGALIGMLLAGLGFALKERKRTNEAPAYEHKH